ncbi:hypothetical protein ES288_A05G425400v1 [Gossypium darwinii]|uniref:Uncharacterized protein n=1 Tax=Gossypium darwinii TaxID=34276 RepID=A0A5D2GQM8_GOSDA|nr:hypothetical protein ES288_A05G425400v1 [Gossypium darwinii]
MARENRHEITRNPTYYKQKQYAQNLLLEINFQKSTKMEPTQAVWPKDPFAKIAGLSSFTLDNFHRFVFLKENYKKKKKLKLKIF